MIIAVLGLTFLEGKAEEGFATMHESLKVTRAFDGCISIEVAQDVNDPHKAIVVERWQSLAHDTAYREYATRTGRRAAVAALLDGPPTKSICEVRTDV